MVNLIKACAPHKNPYAFFQTELKKCIHFFLHIRLFRHKSAREIQPIRLVSLQNLRYINRRCDLPGLENLKAP